MEIAKELPELRLPVESFEQFCLLLDKDAQTITTILDKKSKEVINLDPFGVAETVSLEIYNDINILFGSKGTGKTEILYALSEYYNNIGFNTKVYVSSSNRLEEEYDLRGLAYNATAESFGLEECTEDFTFLRSATEKDITSLNSYERHFSTQETNKISQNIVVKDLQLQDDASLARAHSEVRKTAELLQNFSAKIAEDSVLENVVGEDLFERLSDILGEIEDKIKEASGKRLLDLKTAQLFNMLVSVFAKEIAKKTGQPEKPLKTGFKEYASNRIAIERSVKKIVLNLSIAIPPDKVNVGCLGEKGDLWRQTNVLIQEGNLIDGSYAPIKKVAKTPQKAVAKAVSMIVKHLYENSLFEKISDLKNIEEGETIACISDLLVFKRFFVLDDAQYNPSTGESSMVLLHNELMEEKNIYIIDEPEKSLGNDYISEVIVPLLKERARMGCKVIIATHDANIAVRTLPYNSVFRRHDSRGYCTFTGNPFSNNLKCINNVNPSLDWKEISMRTLEGGREAFGERSKIYGTANV